MRAVRTTAENGGQKRTANPDENETRSVNYGTQRASAMSGEDERFSFGRRP
ncbi:uncharacterized protein G2W53_039144 [Senna tora]|uniref:Uncharacterized protein n=1 Tax=Senna tora TaxID=362788 RepID=A0A834SQ79_9FABA|nr:uncharacterized protein G2W53_039144 [Senna tora]